MPSRARPAGPGKTAVDVRSSATTWFRLSKELGSQPKQNGDMTRLHATALALLATTGSVCVATQSVQQSNRRLEPQIMGGVIHEPSIAGYYRGAAVRLGAVQEC